MAYRLRIRIGLFRTHDGEIDSPIRPHEYQLSHLNTSCSLRSIRCASRETLLPRGMTSEVYVLSQLFSKEQNHSDGVFHFGPQLCLVPPVLRFSCRKVFRILYLW